MESKVKYNFWRFKKPVKMNRQGNTALVERLSAEFKTKLKEFHPWEVGDDPCYHETTKQIVERTSEYVVGTCFVKYDINLALGATTLDLVYAKTNEIPELVKYFKDRYPETMTFFSENMV